MDDTNVPVIDLNIDPNMIAAQDAPPQTAPANPQSTTASVTPSVGNSNIIDITPGSDDTLPLSEPKTMDITPPTSSSETPSHLSELSPEPTPVESIPLTPLQVPPSAPITINPISEESVSPSPAPVETPQPNPKAEDPDLVKLIK